MNEINLDVNDALQKTVNDLEKGAMALDDKGHMQLMTDLKSFLGDAEAGKYHDFHPNGHLMPKVALISTLQRLIDAGKNGSYDN